MSTTIIVTDEEKLFQTKRRILIRFFLVMIAIIFVIDVNSVCAIADNSKQQGVDHALQIEVSARCPAISDVQEFSIQCPIRKDGRSIPCNVPVVLKIPAAYITADARNHLVAPMPYALYDTLQPACTQFKNSSLFVDRKNSLTLELDRYTEPDVEIENVENQVKNQKVWKLIQDIRYPNYRRYNAFADPKLDNNILIPNTPEIDTHYVITCMNLRWQKIQSSKGSCVLYTNYRGQLLVKSLFHASHLNDIPKVYQKTVVLLDRFYALANKDIEK